MSSARVTSPHRESHLASSSQLRIQHQREHQALNPNSIHRPRMAIAESSQSAGTTFDRRYAPKYSHGHMDDGLRRHSEISNQTTSTVESASTPPRTPPRPHARTSHLPQILVDNNAPTELYRGDTSRPRDLRRVRSAERTRSWAEEVQRHQTKEEKKASRRNLTVKPAPYVDTWTISAELIDSHLAELSPHGAYTDFTSDLPTAASVISNLSKKSLRLVSSDEESVGEDEQKDRRMSSSSRRRSSNSRQPQTQRSQRAPPTTRQIEPKATSVASTKSALMEPPKRTSASPVIPSKPALPKPTVMSIDDIVRKHSSAMASAEAAARDKARKSLGLSPKSPARDMAGTTSPSIPIRSASVHDSTPAGAGSITAGSPVSLASRRDWSSPRTSELEKHQRRRKHDSTPPIPPRSSSSPRASMLQPPRPKTMFGLGVGEDDTQSSADSVTAGAIMSQALLDRLEKGSTPSSPDPTISASPKAIRLSQLDQPVGVAELNRKTSSPTPRLKRRSLNSPSPRPMSSPEDHAMAVYLSSARLNRYVHLPRPFPERPLKVSIAEVGQATGTPVLVFLGLGCVRYLIALFDDLAKALNLRLICIDRWGYGKTDNVPEESRTTASWAMVVERVLTELDIDHFRIIAHSAGCPYAAAVALRLGDRVKGKLNFLAPWVNADTDGGYKWLKWVPNGVIKGAVAAEWRLQSYRLGKPPPLVHRPISHIAETPSANRPSPERSWSEGVKGVQQRIDSDRHTFHGGSPEVRGPSLMRRASQVLSGRVESTAIAEVAASTVGVETRSATPPKSRLRNLRSLTPLRTHSETGTQPITTPSTTLSSNATSFELQSPHHEVTLSSVAQIGLTEGFDPSTTTADLQYLALPHIDKMTLDDTASSPSTTDKPVTGPALTHALMQASHAECEPGTTKDLLTIVLNKSAQGDGGGYIGVTNCVSVWWGDEDEKISEKSIRWLEKGLAQSGAQVEVTVVQGEGHNLMTCSQVMCEVFLGIYKDVKAEIASGSFQPRSREGHPRAR